MRHSLRLFVLCFALCLTTIPVCAQVQTVGDVSFAVPAGWTYAAAPDSGAMVIKEGASFWLVGVYAAMPTSGDKNADFKTAWKRVVLALPNYQRFPDYSPYSITKMVGYQGVYYDADSGDRKSYVRLYVLETGKSCIPVVFLSANRQMLDGMEYMARAIVGSVRQTPLKASPIRNTITVADLEGTWKSGLVTSIDYYNSSGQYQSNSLTAVNYGYTIAANGSYSYKFAGLINNRMTNDDDTGVVGLGEGYLTFNGKKRHHRYRFINLQQALDGATVLTLFPDTDMSKIDPSRDSEYYTRAAKK